VNLGKRERIVLLKTPELELGPGIDYSIKKKTICMYGVVPRQN
jgi:hypothetical protein